MNGHPVRRDPTAAPSALSGCSTLEGQSGLRPSLGSGSLKGATVPMKSTRILGSVSLAGLAAAGIAAAARYRRGLMPGLNMKAHLDELARELLAWISSDMSTRDSS